MKSMFMRLFTSTLMILAVSFMLLGTLFFSYCTRYIVTEKHDELTTTAQEVAHSAVAYKTGGESLAENWNFRMSVDSLGRASDCRIFVCDDAGKVKICSGEGMMRADEGKMMNTEAVLQVMENGEYFGMTNEGAAPGDATYVVGLLVQGEGETPIGMIFVSTVAANIMALRVKLMTGFILIAVVVFVIAFFVMTYISKRQTRPIDEIADAANSFASGHLDARVKIAVQRKDELGRLAVSFNAMADSLEQSEKRRQEFVSNVSHELKTPMTTIGGFVDGILDGTIPQEQERKYLTIISDEIKRLSRLVRTLLQTSRLQDQVEKQPWHPFDIVDMAVGTMLSFEKKIEEKHLEVDMNVPEEPVMVVGSSDSINQVLYNLMDNAVKFSNPGGRVGLGIRVKGGKANITVSNTGETIPLEQQKLIFDRFHKTDVSRSKDKDGVGLGLYIVQTIITKHGEDINVISNDGLTEFTFTMTLAQKETGNGRK